MTQTSIDNNFIYIHIRPGHDGKSHPVGTIAINIVPTPHSSYDDYHVGFSVRHSKDTWISSLGRSIAAGRALRSNQNCVVVNTPKNISRNEIMLLSIEAIYSATKNNKIKVSRKFRRAIDDTFVRLEKSFNRK